MSNLDNVVRPFWLSGLNDISGLQQKGLGGLICDESYQIYSQVSSTSFILSFAETKPLLSAFAGDISRFGAASFESIVDIRKPVALRKSSAWLIVQTYYSAFFSAHAILRLMGESCSQLEREQVNSIHKVANLFGAMSTSTLNGGLYHLIADGNAKTISETALPGSSHEAFWKLFHERILRLAADALTVTTESASN